MGEIEISDESRPTSNRFSRKAVLSSYEEFSTLGSKSFVVSSFTGLSRVLGLLRDVVFSFYFGASPVAEAFFVAFRIPNFFRRLLAEGAFAQAFVPVLSELREKESREALEEFVRSVAGNFGLVLIAISIVGVALSPILVSIFTLGAWQSDSRFELATDLLRVMFPYLALISFTAFAGAILNSFNRFAIPALTPILLNVALIAGAIAGAQWFEEPVFVLAWAVIIAGIVQFVFHVPSLGRLRLLKLPKLDWKSPPIRQMMKLLGPAVYAASAGQINILVGTILAAQLTAGSLAWLYYADRLIELPVGMIAIAIQTVLLPRLSSIHSQEDKEAFKETLTWGLRTGIVLGLPASVGLIYIALPIISTIFFRGEFSTVDVEKVTVALQAFAIGVLPLMLVRVAASGYFARHDTRTPFKYASISVGVNIAVSLALFKVIGHVGIALATSIAAIVHSFLLIRGLHVRKDVDLIAKLGKVCVQVAIGCVTMIFTLYYFNPGDEIWLHLSTWARVGWLTTLLLMGIGVYFVTLFLVGMRMSHFIERE